MNDMLWRECVRFHGHACPGLALGYRAAEVGMEQLGIPLERATDEEIICVAENEACGVDAIQYLISCTIGKGNLILRPSGKMAFSFFDRDDGDSVRVVAKNFDRNGDREVLIQKILTDPYGNIFDIKRPRYDLPKKARLFDSVECESCGEYCREDKIRLQNGKKYCTDCFDQYDRG
ncbi:MAG: FmdE family protein [Candidatus Methanomethylophilaceae archaeon]